MDNTAPVRHQVNQLVAMYGDYKAIIVRQAECRRQLAKAKLRREDISQLQAVYDDLAVQLLMLSDAMTYASPSIWVLYKYEAYADEPQAIRTLADFRQHCSKPGYICTKRFTFVNAALAARDTPDLNDVRVYPDDQQLDTIMTLLTELENDEAFMKTWDEHEYYMVDGRVAKWKNFT